MNAEFKAYAFGVIYDNEVSNRAALVASHAFNVCKLDKADPDHFTSQQVECVQDTSKQLWSIFKSADTHMPRIFFV